MQVSTILDQIDLGSIALPEFQRGYVWNRDQVKKFMMSLYRKHPVGSLLVWLTKTEYAETRGDGSLTPGTVQLLLDGQQRITSLYGIIRGKTPKFFEGNEKAFTGLYYNLEEEVFEFYLLLKMKDNPLWIDVTDLMQKGAAEVIQPIMANPDLRDKSALYLKRLNEIDNIKQFNFHIDQVTGEEKTVDIVVDIFNNVNSGGTKLSKGDLALAKVCAEWPDARQEMNKSLDKWKRAGFNFKIEWLLRCVNTILTGEALFSALKNVNSLQVQEGLIKAEKYINSVLNLFSARLGLDHDRVLGSRYSFPLIVRCLDRCGGRIDNHSERDKLLYWYIHTFLWGRYAGSTESVLNQDIGFIEESKNGLDKLIDGLRQSRGDLNLQSNDFLGWSKGARFYPLLYMMTRVYHAKDWITGIELSAHLLGNINQLQVHHIFPKAALYKNNFERHEVNAIANFTFLTQDTNLFISDKEPLVYFEEIQSKNPGVLESHWIPMDKNLWRIENYLDFLDARKQLLADAANSFLENLIKGEIPETEGIESIIDRDVTSIPGGVSDEDEEQLLIDTNLWIIEAGLPEGEMLYELTDPHTGKPSAILDLAWPEGLQKGLSDPVALLLNEGLETIEAVNNAGFKYYTSVEEFKNYVEEEILSLEEAD